MVVKINFKLKLYRRYELDIWGLALIDLKPKNKYLEFLQKLYLLQEIRKRRHSNDFSFDQVYSFRRKDKKKIKKRFSSLRLLKLYYVILKYRHFRKIASLAARRDGFFQNNFTYFLEGRICSILYRTSLVTTMFSAISFIKNLNVLVNKKLISKPNSFVKVGDLINFMEDEYKFFRFNLLSRLKNRGVFFSPPRYMAFSYKLNVFTLVVLPKDLDLAFPINLDIYRVSGYY